MSRFLQSKNQNRLTVFALIVAMNLIGAYANAELIDITVTGMHCGSCEATIEKAACKGKDYSACEANITDSKKQQGHLKIETKEGQTVDTKALIEKINKLGYQAELTSSTKTSK